MSTLTSSHLKLLLGLTKRKEAIAADLHKLEAKIAGLFGIHTGPAKSSSKAPAKRGRPAKKPKAAQKPKAAKKTRTRVARGTLKEKVLTVLKEAGAEGLGVGEVADKIGAKKAAVNVWFYTTGKKVAGLKKIAPGKFALKG